MATKKVLDTQVTIELGSVSDNENPLIVIERGSDEICPLGKVCYRIFPQEVIDVRVSAGRIKEIGSPQMILKKEYLTFQNSDRASLRYPVAGGAPEVKLDYVFDEWGEPADLKFEWDPTGNAIRTRDGTRFFGAGLVEYYTTYRSWKYYPEVNAIGGSIYDGVSVLFGTILAHYKKSFLAHQVGPNDIDDALGDKIEVYRVVSKVVVAENGSWETPIGWPDKNWDDYAIGTAGECPTNNSVFIEYDRVHEIGYIPAGKIGLRVETYYTPWVKPYIGSYNYKPLWECRMIDTSTKKQEEHPSSLDELEASRIKNKFALALDFVDFCAIKRDLQKRYPKVSFTPENANCT